MNPRAPRVPLLVACVALGWVALGIAGVAVAAEITATVRDQANEPVADAVVVAVRSGPPISGVRPGREVVDQIDKEFVPYVKAVLVGSAVFFPNKDNIRHHVYSFSPAKTFELPLYIGTPAHPVVFDKPGVVTIGCNIHDWMIAHIYVAERPYFGTTRTAGTVKLENLPAGAYAVRVWHPRMQVTEESTVRSVTVGAAPVEATWQLTLKQDLRPRRAPVPGQRGYR
jgi:plastocyanin